MALCFALVAGRVVYVNTAMNDRLMDYRYRQSKRLINLQARRGSILDMNGNVLAMDVPSQSVYAVPQSVEHKRRIAARLAGIFDLERKDVLRELRKDAPFVWIKRRATDNQIHEFKTLNLTGFGFLDETRRVYPNNTLAASIVGFYGDDRGVEGIEATYQDRLKGESGFIELEKDAIGRNVPNSVRRRQEPVNGNDVYLTIDKVLQYTAEKELRAAVEEHSATGGAVVVLEVGTSRVLAMASSPGFDPAHFQDYEKKAYRNNAVSYVYEPGSIMKPVIAASAMDAGLYGAHSPTIYCPSSFRVDGYTITESHHEGHGQIDLATVVKKSSNIGMAQVGINMGAERIQEYLKRFGFGQKIRIGLYGSEYGLLPWGDNWERKSTLATVSYGQGISVTPLQMVMAFSAIANDGVLVPPVIVDRVQSPNGKVLEKPKRGKSRRVISADTARSMRDILLTVVEDGTGKAARIPNYTVGGKTGTALVAVNGSYRARKYNASFVGMAPVDRPRVIVLAVVNEPHPYYYAGIVAAPLFQKVMTQALLRLKVPPSQIAVSSADMD